MPGLGKTTLAKNLFDNSLVQNHFDRRMWCVISQTYEKRKVFIEILMSLNKHDKEKLLDADEEKLGLMIHKNLKGNRYLVVIDDIWNSSVWNDMRRFFPDDNNGSRIMLPSRIKDATPNESIFHTLPLLSKVECLDLLVKKVFPKQHCPPQLLGIAERIAAKCHGLPLTVVVVAGMLANMHKQESAWKTVEENLNSFIFDDNRRCMEVLEFSFDHLPDHLKLCFMYLGTFPEDSKIPIKKLILLWIAEGFIQKEEERSQEESAKQYLNDLIDRSLVLIFVRKFDGAIKTCGVHDLLRDMCLKKADEENFLNPLKITSRCTRDIIACVEILIFRRCLVILAYIVDLSQVIFLTLHPVFRKCHFLGSWI